MKTLAVSLIKFYRKYLSILKIRCCRFHPSCSEYAIEAIEKHGFFSGSWKSLKRLSRCHPFSRGGYDPVR
jgi:putative membrane protein insertion efficiency factor